MSKIIPEYKEDLREAKGLWAPGDYLCQCTKCHEPFIGDKRAIGCADCAYGTTSLLHEVKHGGMKMICLECGKPIEAKALHTGDGWHLHAACGCDDVSEKVYFEWPEGIDSLEAKDLMRLGFDII
jgi:hypothetical protein